MRVQEILCTVDFSDGSHEALQRAIELARESSAHLTILNVYPLPYYAAVVCAPEVLKRVQNEAERNVARWASDARALGASVDGVTRMGIPWQEILELARERHCDVIVMGTHGRTGTKRAALGSVAEAVVRRAPCTVMVVRPRESQDASAAA